jgi:hypothetical protein
MKILAMWSTLLLAANAQAGVVIYDFTINTLPLMGNVAGPFSLGFQLADGSNAGDGNNAAVLSGFQFGGGGAAGLPVLVGSAFGDLSTTITLTDAMFPTFFIQGFNPGGSLQFQLSLTTDVDPGGTPDAFIFVILDSTLTPLPTTAGPFFDAFAQIVIDGPNPTVTAFASDTLRSSIDLGAPSIQSAVPEPSSLLSAATAFFAFGLLSRRRALRQ